ncbi:MAG: Ppx/GppA phosphatase family protein [Myxococcales bacterium]
MTRRNTLRLSTQESARVWTHLGVIDLGSNAIRLQVARVFEDGDFRIVHDEREPVRLGEDAFRTGKLSKVASERALQTLARYAETARRHGAAQVRSVATSAVREAINGEEFTREVERATGLRVEVISGPQEAQLIARGVLSGFHVPGRRVALVDIGGGSTEISIVVYGQVRFSGSLPLGSVRLTEAYCTSDPLRAEDEHRLRMHVRQELCLRLDPLKIPRCGAIIGSAGTIGALANFIRRRPSAHRNSAHLRSSFTTQELARACATLRTMTLAKRRVTRGIEERRAEIIVAGALLLQEICIYLHARSVKVVRRGLRDGLMLEEIERLGPPPQVPAPKNEPPQPPRPPLPARKRGTRESA